MRASEIIDTMHRIAPSWLATEGDPIGLRAGDPSQEVRTVALALDASLPSVTAAANAGAKMLITHHPAFYRGLKNLDTRTSDGRIASTLLKNDIVLFSAHTNLDIATGGVNDVIAQLLNLQETEPLAHEETRLPLQKLTVFIPESHLDAVRTAVCDAGAGVIGAYHSCTWSTEGTGSFFGTESTHPTVGEKGRLESVPEMRLETVVPQGCQSAVIRALRATHPYEEPAYDLHTIQDHTQRGCGRVGNVPAPLSLDAFALQVREAFGASHVQVFDGPVSEIRRVAVWGGGSAPVSAAVRAKADILVAGEFRYHDCDTARDGNMALLALGHGVSEQVVLAPLAEHLRQAHPDVQFIVLDEGFSAFRAV